MDRRSNILAVTAHVVAVTYVRARVGAFACACVREAVCFGPFGFTCRPFSLRGYRRRAGESNRRVSVK